MPASRWDVTSRRGALVLTPAALLFAACGSSGDASNAGSHGPSIVHIALAADPSSLDPQLPDDGNARAVVGNIAETLVNRDAQTNAPQPGLATSWRAVDPTTWEFKLRSGVKFSDGEPFNADAVVYSVKRITDPNYKTEQGDWVGDITGAKKVDDLTVDVTTSSPDTSVPRRMSLIFMVPPQASQNADFAAHPVGTGPYVFVSWTKGAQAVIKANPDYWGGKPKIDEAIFQPIKEPTVLLSALKAGELDVVSELLPEQMSQVPQAVRAPGLEFPTVILDTRGGAFKDERVRMAANYAIDRKSLLQKLYLGFGQPANCQMMGQAVFGFNPDLKDYTYDPNKARQLIQEASPPTLNIDLVGDSSNRWLKDVELEQAIQGYLQDVGFKVNLKLEDFSTYLKDLFPTTNNATTQRPDMVFVSHDNLLGDADITFSNYYLSSGGGASTSDSTVDQLIDSARHASDSTQRQQAYQQVNKIACDHAYFINLFNLDNVYGLSSRLQWKPRYDAYIFVKDMSLQG